MPSPLMYVRFRLIIGFVFCAALPAQDFYGAGVSAETAARAGIYLPSRDGSGNSALDALSLNPAGLAFLRGPVANLSVLGAVARGNFTNAANIEWPMRPTAGVVPYGAIGIPLGKRWTIAAGFVPDLLSAAKWQFKDAPGVAGANYGVRNEKSEITAVRGTAGISYRVSKRVSVGMTVSGIYNANTLQMPYVFQSNPDLKGLKTLLNLHTTGAGWNAGFGVIVIPSSHWELGAAFRTRSGITSSGTATGNMGAQFAALNIPFRPDFSYRAQVNVEIPQSALVSIAWQKSPVLRLSFQTNWVNWHESFAKLPVSLTNGTNPDINGFLQSTSIKDSIPLQWKDQFAFRGAVERRLGESYSVSAGYAHQNNPVPSSTLSPLTAAIMTNALTAGVGHTWGRIRFDAGYQINLNAHESVSRSALLSGEFSNSRVSVGTQALILSTSFRL